MSTTTEHNLTSFRVHLHDGTSYVTSMAAGVTVTEARAYFVGQEIEQRDERTKLTVVDVTPADDNQPEQMNAVYDSLDTLPPDALVPLFREAAKRAKAGDHLAATFCRQLWYQLDRIKRR